MTNEQKSFIALFLVVLLLLVGGYYIFATGQLRFAPSSPSTMSTSSVSSSAASTTTDPHLKSYIGSDFSFHYPDVLHTLQDNETVTITHSIPYTHPNVCDFKGDAPPLAALTDFNTTIKVVNLSVKEYVEKSGSPNWDYVSENSYSFGPLVGYHVTLGVEGCGEDLYYFEISPHKTIVITRASVAEFSPVIGEYKKYLSLPGVIAPATSEVYFAQILSSLTVK